MKAFTGYLCNLHLSSILVYQRNKICHLQVVLYFLQGPRPTFHKVETFHVWAQVALLHLINILQGWFHLLETRQFSRNIGDLFHHDVCKSQMCFLVWKTFFLMGTMLAMLCYSSCCHRDSRSMGKWMSSLEYRYGIINPF